MKKGTFIIGILLLILFIAGQEIQEKAIAINIEVPVRVFTKGKFVEELNLEDFEVYEDGVLQKVEALYLVKKTVIDREETELDKKSARRIYIPEVSRTFVLVFELIDYFPEIKETLDYFFEHVFLKDDSLYIVTPKKTYPLKNEFLNKTPKDMIAKQLNERLRKDFASASREYKSMIRDLRWMESEGVPGDAKKFLRQKIRDFRHLDEKKLVEFKNQLSDIKGKKYVYLFYQRQVLPDTSSIDLRNARLFFDIEKIKKIFTDSSICINFIFLTKTNVFHSDVENIRPSGTSLRDISSGMFSTFYEMAKVTGGITDSSANLASSFKRVAIASENYYILYYSPMNYMADGKYRKIEVKLKDKKYRVIHRTGYIAD